MSEQHKNPRRWKLKPRNILSFNVEIKYFNTTKMVLARAKCSKHKICFSLPKVKICQIYINRSVEYKEVAELLSAFLVLCWTFSAAPDCYRGHKAPDPMGWGSTGAQTQKIVPFKGRSNNSLLRDPPGPGLSLSREGLLHRAPVLTPSTLPARHTPVHTKHRFLQILVHINPLSSSFVIIHRIDVFVKC